MHRFVMTMVVASFVLCSAAAAADKGPSVKFEADGKLIVQLDGVPLVEEMLTQASAVAHLRGAGEKVGLFGYDGNAGRIDKTAISSSFDPASRTVTHKYAWGSISRQYESNADRLDIRLTVKNESNDVLYALETNLLNVRVAAAAAPAPVTEGYFGAPARTYLADNFTGPLALPLVSGDRAIVACSGETKHLQLSWAAVAAPKAPKPSGKHGDPTAQELADQNAQRTGGDQQAERSASWALKLSAGGDRVVWHGRYSSRPIAPGASDTYAVSLRFGEANAPLAPAADVCKAYGEAHPMALKWDDRRPILRSFIGDNFPYHAPLDMKMTKPSGIAPGDDFRKSVMASADSMIANLTLINGQGMVLWNVEGSTVPAIKYVGDPQKVEVMCPEFDALADEYFGRFRKAGFRTGVCIRPSVILPYEANDGLRYKHSYPGDDPVEVLAGKIKYAKDRWGCTLFYIDTNHNLRYPKTDEEKSWWPKQQNGQFKPYKELMSAEQWQELYRRFPDILLIPEHTYPLCYTATGPYDQMNMGQVAGAGVTPPLVLATWPKAFKCLTGDLPTAKYFDRTVATFAQGDILMLNSPVEDGGRPLAAARTLAEFRKLAPPAGLARKSRDELVAQAADANATAQARYFAVAALLAATPADSQTLATLLDGNDWLARKLALDAVSPANGDLADKLVAVAAEPKNTLAWAAYVAVGRIGPAAIPVLRTKAFGADRAACVAAVRALCEIKDPAGPAAAMEMLKDANAPVLARVTLIEVLSPHLKGKASDPLVDAMLGFLKDPTLRVAVAAGLAVSSDARVKPALEDALKAEQAAPKPDAKFISVLQRSIGLMK